jgi:hypothetical protein
MYNKFGGADLSSNGKGVKNAEDKNDSDEDSYQGAAMNLLDIRNPSRWEIGRLEAGITAEAQQGSGRPLGEMSITKLYQPKFLEVFMQYSESSQQSNSPVKLTKQLMALSLEHLVPFSCWARETNARSTWIHTVLEENIDLRPEVRNGLAMVLIYALSAAKASQESEADMFTILQDAESGLGIVNKTSLKIYNDPFTYFSFLKSCLSGLIDAGKVPENERQNQPKKAKRQAENKDEIFAFMQLKTLLVALLTRGDHMVARNRVQQVCALWQQRQKSIRNQRFAMALALIAGPQQAVQVLKQKALAFEQLQDNAGLPLDPLQLPAPAPSNSPSQPQLPAPPAFSWDSSAMSAPSRDETQRPAKQARSALSSSSARGGAECVPALRFERVAGTEWEMQDSKIFMLESLVLGHAGTFCLVDESRLDGRRLLSQGAGIVALSAALQSCGALVTSWPKAEHAHMLDFLESWRSAESPGVSLLGCWQARHGLSSAESSAAGHGVLAYEVLMQVGLVLRANADLDIDEDCWRLVYLRDLQSETQTASLSAFLMRFFPQLRVVQDKIAEARTIVVKYLAHSVTPPLTQAPALQAVGMYQTVGTVDEHASAVLSRFDTSVSFHDIMLQVR